MFRLRMLLAGTLCVACAPSPTWIEVRSRHFVLQGDVGVSRGEELVRDLERSYAALRSCVSPGGSDPPGMTEVVAFDDEEEYRKVAPRGAGAYFSWRSNLVESRRKIVFPANSELRAKSREEVLQHELTHRFIAHYMPNVPVWFNEGMAEFLSTARLDGAEVVMGEPPSIYWLSASGWMVNREPLVRVAPDPAWLRTVTTGRFDWTGYVGAWMLVNVMVLGEPRHRRALERYLNDLRSGDVSEPDARAAHFDAETLAEIDANYVAFQTRTTAQIQAVALDAPPALELDSRVVPPAEALAARARLWPLTRSHQMQALEDANRAIGLDPKSPEGYLLRALVLVDAKNLRAAAGDLRTALRLAPEDRRVRRGLGAVVLELEGPTTEAKQQIDWLRPRAKAAEDFRVLAVWELFMRHPESAVELAKRGVALDVWCIPCYELAAEASFRFKDRAEAIRWQRQALNVAADRATSKMFERLARFEKAPFPAKKNPRLVAPNSAAARAPKGDAQSNP